jgi:hypothetical protein
MSRLVALGALALVACGARQPAPVASVGQECDSGLEAGESRLQAPPPLAPLTSQVAVELSVSRERIQDELGRRVPSTLDQATRDIGAPGRVTYVVTRGPFAVDLRNDRLVTTTRVRARVDVCKELGPFCVHYGHCDPSLLAVASVPLLPGSDYSLGPSQVSVTVEQGCTIAGYDATSELERIARQQAAVTQRRIDAAMPQLGPQVGQAWSTLAQPWLVEGVGCLLARPKSLKLVRPTLEGGRITARVGMDAELGWSPACPGAAEVAPSPPLPPPAVVQHIARESHLELGIRLGWNEAGAELAKSLAGPGDDSIMELRARPALVGGRKWLALGLHRRGLQCETMWLLSEPSYDPSQGNVGLRVEKLLAGNAADYPAVKRLLEERGRILLPFRPERVKELMGKLAARLDTERPDRADLDLGLEDPAVGPVVADREGLVAVVSLRARISLSAK